MKPSVADISQLRQRIDSIDDRVIQLILERIELSSLIMQTKPQSQIVDPGREKAIVHRYFEKLSTASTLPKTQRLVQGIIGASRIYPDA